MMPIMVVCAQGRRDVQGEEDDREGEGELEHVRRYWREAITRKGERPIYHPRLLSVEMASANAIIHE